MNEARTIVHRLVRAIAARWRTRQAGFTCTALTTIAFAWLLAVIVADNLLMLPASVMLGAWGLLACIAAVFLALLLYWLTFGRPSHDRLALMYERVSADHRDRLINSVQMLRSGRAASDPFAQAVVIENAGRLDPALTRRAVDFSAVRRTLMWLIVAAIVLGGYCLLRPEWAHNALARIAQPSHPPRHLLATDPVSLTGDATIIEGRPLTIDARLRANLAEAARPDAVTLEYRIGDRAWSRVTMTRGDGNAPFTHHFDAVWQPMDYRIRAGRSVSPKYHVDVRRRPRVEDLRITVTRPQYAGGDTRHLDPGVGDVTALVGSTVHLRVTASQPLAEASIERSDANAVAMTIHEDDPTRAEAAFELNTSGNYRIRLVERSSDRLTNHDASSYSLVAEPDEAPAALVTRPGRDLVLPADAELPLRIEVSDDIGLRRVALQVRHGSSEWRNLAEWNIDDANAVTHRQVEHTLELASLDVEPGDLVFYRAQATDNRQPKPNVAAGHTWSVTIAAASAGESVVIAESRRLLEDLRQILKLQKTNRSAVDMDKPADPIRARQTKIRDRTVEVVDAQRKRVRPPRATIDTLVQLADGPMLRLIQLLNDYGGAYADRAPAKQRILTTMDHVIEALAKLIGEVERNIAKAEQADRVLEQLDPEQRDEALKRVRDMLRKLRDFSTEQDQVIKDTEALARKGEDFTEPELQKIEKLKGAEDEWAEVFTDSVKDIQKLTEQGFADQTIANDYKEMVEQIEAASRKLDQKLVEMAVPREQAGREMAESLAEEMEMWLPAGADNLKWMMEEPLDMPEIPMVELPDQLHDLIGELIEEQDELNDMAEDLTSAWADSIAEGAGWEVAGGPISNFSAVGKTGNQLPDDNEISGRSGEGRSGRSQGQMVEDVAKGLSGRKTPTRNTNDPYEQGVVKELQEMATSGATGGGKARGGGREGLEGDSPPPLYDGLEYMKDWQKRLRSKAQRTAGQLRMIRMTSPDMSEIIELMKQAERDADDGRYQEMFQTQRMVLSRLRRAQDLVVRNVSLRVDRAYHAPADQRRPVLDAADEPVPMEYRQAVRRYFENLSEDK